MAKCKGTKVSQEEVEEMVKLYRQLGTYKAVGKRLRRSPATVARHLGEREKIAQVAQYYDNLITIRYGSD